MFNFHTHIKDSCDCLLNLSPDDVREGGEVCSVGLHPWDVAEDWREKAALLRSKAQYNNVWAIGECGLDKLRGGAMASQMEAFRAQVIMAEELKKPVVIHCVKAFDELLMIRKELADTCRRNGVEPQKWILHGFRGKPEQAKQMMAKGILLSFGHQYNIESLRAAYEAASISACPFFLETDDLRLSVRQIYEQASLHLGVGVDRLESLCDPRQTVFCRSCR